MTAGHGDAEWAARSSVMALSRGEVVSATRGAKVTGGMGHDVSAVAGAVVTGEMGDGAGAVHPYKLASVLLQYPTAALFEGLDVLAAAARSAPRPARDGLMAVVGWLAATPPQQVAEHYVATFDLRRRCTLYLTYHRYGDTRKRGMAMLAFKAAYRAAGLEQSGGELPDYLPLVLDFAAAHPRGQSLLRAHRADLELLRAALRDAGTPYAGAVEAVCACAPRLGRRDAALVSKARELGPPAEETGLEPFAPPDYLRGWQAAPAIGLTPGEGRQ